MTTTQATFAGITAENDLESKLLDQARATFREYVTQKIDQGIVAEILDDYEGDERDEILYVDVIVDTAQEVHAAADPGRLKGSEKASVDDINFDLDSILDWTKEEMISRVRKVADERGEQIGL